MNGPTSQEYAGESPGSPSASPVSGDDEYKSHIGPTEFYDLQTAIQFNLLTALGLREWHYLLDIGCGSLRAGRLFIPYLQAGHYHGIEPLPWLIEEGIRKEVGTSMVELKRPRFSHSDDFELTGFGQQFDFMIAQSIFSHASQAQIRRCVSEAKRTLHPNGVFAATFFLGPVDYEGTRWVYKADYTMETMQRLIAEEGMACTPIDWNHPDPQQWILIHHPGKVVALAMPVDAQTLQSAEERLALMQTQFLAIKRHPYVRFGLWIKFLLLRLGHDRRRILRAARSALGRR